MYAYILHGCNASALKTISLKLYLWAALKHDTAYSVLTSVTRCNVVEKRCATVHLHRGIIRQIESTCLQATLNVREFSTLCRTGRRHVEAFAIWTPGWMPYENWTSSKLTSERRNVIQAARPLGLPPEPTQKIPEVFRQAYAPTVCTADVRG